MSIVSESEPTLQDLISREIKRLSSSHNEEDQHLINNVLRPMLLFIEDHYSTMTEMARIGSKHSL
tara:strand:+ start:372 stop:566 length:195 start_codon:yes stop_codon:yes gene_type:complete